MNPYRSRSPNSAINRIAVAFVVLIALGAIIASILLGPKPNATIVLMQPIRPAAASTEPSNVLTTSLAPAGTAASSDPLASVPADQLPVIQSRPAQPITSDSHIEQSELGAPPADSSAMTDGSSTTASSAPNIVNSSQSSTVTQNQANSSTTAPSVTPSSATNSSQTTDTQTKPATVAAASSAPSTVSSSAVRPVQTITKPDPATSNATTSSAKNTIVASAPTAASSASSVTAPSSATPRRAFLRRATNGVSVQVVALSNLDAAAKLAQNLAANGFTANVQPSGSVYRVVIGPYASETAAQAAATRATGFFR